MIITSTSFSNGGTIPPKYSRQGGDISPPLTFSDMPTGVKGLALICHDPDAPRANGWTHWVVWNIAPTTLCFVDGGVPEYVVQGTTDWGETKWGGPQPPSGTHRYIFYLYALDTTLDLPVTTGRASLERAMQGHIVATATLTGLFSA